MEDDCGFHFRPWAGLGASSGLAFYRWSAVALPSGRGPRAALTRGPTRPGALHCRVPHLQCAWPAAHPGSLALGLLVGFAVTPLRPWPAQAPVALFGLYASTAKEHRHVLLAILTWALSLFGDFAWFFITSTNSWGRTCARAARLEPPAIRTRAPTRPESRPAADGLS